MSDIKDDFAKVALDGKITGLMQAQVIALTAACMYPNHRAVCQIIADKIATLIPQSSVIKAASSEQLPEGE
jgi:hypothetical protein